MRKLILAAGLVASLGAAGAATIASADPYYHHDRYYHDRYDHRYDHRYYRHDRGCQYQTHRNGAIGAVAGAVGGGIIGSRITHGGAGGTLLGAGAGALTGNAIARNTTRC